MVGAVHTTEVVDTAWAVNIAAAALMSCPRVRMQLLREAGNTSSGKSDSSLSKLQAYLAAVSQRGHSRHQGSTESVWASAPLLASRQDLASSRQRRLYPTEGSCRCRQSHRALGQLAFGCRRHLETAKAQQSSTLQEAAGRLVCWKRSRRRENKDRGFEA